MPTRAWAVLTLAMGVFVSGLVASIANVALPTIAHQLGVSAIDVIWIVNSYQLSLVACLLSASALGEIVGYRGIFLSGATLFTVASIGCAFAPNWGVLIASRVLQGIGAAGTLGVANALLRYIFPQRMIGQGFGIYAMIASSSSALGPTVASAILSVFDWPWLFWVSVPIGFIVVLTGFRTLPISDRIARPFDYYGSLLTVLCLVLMLLGVDGLAHQMSAWLLAPDLAAALMTGWLLVRVESRLAEPLPPLDLMRIPVFTLSVFVSIVLYGTQFLAFVSLPFYFRDVLGLSQTITGLLMTPWPLILAVTAPVSGTLADRYSPGILCGIGMLVTSAGLLTWSSSLRIHRYPPYSGAWCCAAWDGR
jgi:MFS transporter, DHA2 family, multidrug resistance protein